VLGRTLLAGLSRFAKQVFKGILALAFVEVIKRAIARLFGWVRCFAVVATQPPSGCAHHKNPFHFFLSGQKA